MKYYYCPFAKLDQVLKRDKKRVFEKNTNAYIRKHNLDPNGTVPTTIVSSCFGNKSKPVWIKDVVLTRGAKALSAVGPGDTIYLNGHGVPKNPSQLSDGCSSTLEVGQLARDMRLLGFTRGSATQPILIRCIVCLSGVTDANSEGHKSRGDGKNSFAEKLSEELSGLDVVVGGYPGRVYYRPRKVEELDWSDSGEVVWHHLSKNLRWFKDGELLDGKP